MGHRALQGLTARYADLYYQSNAFPSQRHSQLWSLVILSHILCMSPITPCHRAGINCCMPLLCFKKRNGTQDIVSLQRRNNTVCSRVMLKVTGHCDPQSALCYEQRLEVLIFFCHEQVFF